MDHFDELHQANPDHLRSELLFAFLCDDDHRPALYTDLRRKAPVYEFPSRARPANDRSEQEFTQRAFLLTRRKDIEEALQSFSNSSYEPIGSGTFVLALDNDADHEIKRDLLLKALRPEGMKATTLKSEIHLIAGIACRHAMVGPRNNATFDLVTDVAEQAALRFVAAYFGIPDQYHVLLQDAMRRTYAAMIYQMFARHFVIDPQVLPDGNLAMATLGKVVSGLAKDADSAALAVKLTPIIAEQYQAAVGAFKSIAESAIAFESLRSLASGYLKAIAQPGLAARTARLLDRCFDLGPMRDSVTTAVSDLDEPLQVALAPLIVELAAKKQQRDEQLVPRKFVFKDDRVGLPPPESPATSLYSRESIIERMARSSTPRSISEIAVAVVGSIAGLVGNVIAGACVAIDRFFSLSPAMRAELVEQATSADPAAGASALLPFIQESLRLQPPAAFIPRRAECDRIFQVDDATITVPAGAEVIIPLGAATRDLPESMQPDTFKLERPPETFVNVFGQPSHDGRSHRCVGDFIAMPLIAHIVRSVLELPGLSRVMKEGQPARLKKKWGYICESLPLQFRRMEVRVHDPLNVVMKIRRPTAEHAAALKVLLRAAVPSIELLLARSEIVHSARFVFLSEDTELGLFTVYDGDFRQYIEYFAKVAGPLFDRIFDHVEDAPPTPVRTHPGEFVEHIARFNVPAAAGYFFSARPMMKLKP